MRSNLGLYASCSWLDPNLKAGWLMWPLPYLNMFSLHSHTVTEYSTAINSILTYYHHPQFKDSFCTEYESAAQIIYILLSSAGAEHPLLNPYTLPGTAHFIHDLMLELRKDEAVLDSSRCVRSKCSTTLVLFSPKERHTPFHFDWTEAKNLALSIEVRGMDVLFAYFLHHHTFSPFFLQGVTDPTVLVATWYLLYPLFLPPFLSFKKYQRFF
jgi:hypothetical protein